VHIHASTHVCHVHRVLYLYSNQLTSVPEGVFNGLTSLDNLNINDNEELTCIFMPADQRATLTTYEGPASNCTCNAGSTGPDGGPCTECVAGKYKIAPGDAACTNCIAGQYSTTAGDTSDVCQGCLTNSHAPEASDEQSDCKCNAGSSGPGGGPTCNLCAKGKYQANTSDIGCDDCTSGKYLDATGNDAEADCKACPANSGNNPAASTDESDCICNPGSSGANGGSCTECVSGMYKTDSGSANCTSCPAQSDSPVGSSMVSACTCNPGYSGPNGGPCTECVEGTYTADRGSANCESCPAYSDSPVGSIITDCICNAGSSGLDGGPCTECVAGKYKIASGDAACTNCSAGQYSTEVGATSDVCQGCQTKSTAPEASNEQTDCTCNTGSTGPDGDPCTECLAGKYKIALGDAACSNCSAGQYSMEVGATLNVCKGCPTNSFAPQASDEQTDCTCTAGSTGPDGGPCTECVAGKYKIASGDSACSNCGKGKYSTITNATSEGTCQSCIAGKYLTTEGNINPSDCNFCLANSYSPHESTALTDCTCNAGHTGPDGGGCTGCTQGFYKETTGSNACTSCANGKLSILFSATSESTCLAACTHEAVMAAFLAKHSDRQLTIHDLKDCCHWELAGYYSHHAARYACRYLSGPSYFRAARQDEEF